MCRLLACVSVCLIAASLTAPAAAADEKTTKKQTQGSSSASKPVKKERLVPLGNLGGKIVSRSEEGDKFTLRYYGMVAQLIPHPGCG